MENLLSLFPVGVPSMTPFGDLLNVAHGNDEKSQEIKKCFRDNNNIIGNKRLHIILVGCGGTGGYVLAELLRIIGSMPEFIQKYIYITAIDGDEFESKNLGRQLCTEDDIGVNKAEALISNYASYFGVLDGHAIAIPEYLTKPEQLTNYKYGIPSYKILGKKREIDNLFEHDKVYHPGKETVLKDDDNIGLRDIGLISNHYSENQNYITPTTIVIDCVDKNAPRKLINDILESAWKKKSVEEKLIDMTFWRDYDNFSKSDDINKDAILDSIVFSYCHNGSNNESWLNFKNSYYGYMDYANGRLILNDYQALGDTYIISSGNGEFSGQVYWGRYSTLIDDVIPTRYDDIWKNGEVASSLISSNPSPFYEGVIKDKSICSYKQLLNNENTIYKNIIKCLGVSAFHPYYVSYREKDMPDLKRRDYYCTPDSFSIGFYLTAKCPALIDKEFYGHSDDPNLRNFEAYASNFVSIPTPYNRHPDLLDLEEDAREDAMSCAERAATNVQNIYTNKTAAQLVVNYFKSILNGIFPLTDKAPHFLTTAGVSFDIRTNTFVSENITSDYLRKYDTYNMLAQKLKGE